MSVKNFKEGDKVRVINIDKNHGDEEDRRGWTKKYVGKTGHILSILGSGELGQYDVGFSDGDQNYFGDEELERAHNKTLKIKEMLMGTK